MNNRQDKINDAGHSNRAKEFHTDGYKALFQLYFQSGQCTEVFLYLFSLEPGSPMGEGGEHGRF